MDPDSNNSDIESECHDNDVTHCDDFSVDECDNNVVNDWCEVENDNEVQEQTDCWCDDNYFEENDVDYDWDNFSELKSLDEDEHDGEMCNEEQEQMDTDTM